MLRTALYRWWSLQLQIWGLTGFRPDSEASCEGSYANTS
jgi:hypothetical protein